MLENEPKKSPYKSGFVAKIQITYTIKSHVQVFKMTFLVIFKHCEV